MAAIKEMRKKDYRKISQDLIFGSHVDFCSIYCKRENFFSQRSQYKVASSKNCMLDQFDKMSRSRQ